MTKKLIAPIFAILVIASLLIYNANVKSAFVKQSISENLPPTPNASVLSEALERRIQKADRNARANADLAGFAELATLYHANGYYREAWSVYRGLVAIDDGNPKTLHRIARILAGYGRLEDAIPLFERVVELDSTYIPTRIHLANAYAKLNRHAEARATNEAVLSIEPRNAWALVGLARSDIANGDWESAKSRLESASNSTSFKVGSDLLADVYETLGDRSRARAIKQNGSLGSFGDILDPWTIELMDQCYDPYQIAMAGGWADHAGDRKTGIRLLERSLALDPNNATTRYQLGNFYLSDGNFAKAQTSFELSVAERPDFADAWIGLIRIAEAGKDRTGAILALDKALTRNPDSPSLNIRKGNQLLDEERPQQAIARFKRAIEFLPNEAGGYINLARAYFITGEEELGIAEMLKALKAEPSNPIALSTMAMYNISNGRRAEAERFLQRSIASPRITSRELDPLIAAFRKSFGRNPKL